MAGLYLSHSLGESYSIFDFSAGQHVVVWQCTSYVHLDHAIWKPAQVQRLLGQISHQLYIQTSDVSATGSCLHGFSFLFMLTGL